VQHAMPSLHTLRMLFLGVFAAAAVPVMALLAPLFFALALAMMLLLWLHGQLIDEQHMVSLPASCETWKEFEASDRSIAREHITRDGVKLVYQVVPADPEMANGKVAFICQPLGNRGWMHWFSTMTALGRGWTFVSWDYRGFYGSEETQNVSSMTVRDHAMDGAEVLSAALRAGDREGKPLAGLEHLANRDDDVAADLVLGHSMGVQVALEFCVLFPDRCRALALFNGTSGNALQTGLGPVCKLPLVGDAANFILAAVDSHLWLPLWVIENVRALYLRPACVSALRKLCTSFGSDTLNALHGPDYLLEYGENYFGPMRETPQKNLKNFLRGFRMLDAHSCTHLLDQVHCPTLLVAGLWDSLTPAQCMVHIASAVRGPTRLVIDPRSAHSTLLEHPERVLGELQHFAGTLPLYERRPSTEVCGRERTASTGLPSRERATSTELCSRTCSRPHTAKSSSARCVRPRARSNGLVRLLAA